MSCWQGAVTGFDNPKLSISNEIVDAAFAELRIHLPDVLEKIEEERMYIQLYTFQLERGIAATNTSLGSPLSL